MRKGTFGGFATIRTIITWERMTRMKRLKALVLTLAFILVLVGCARSPDVTTDIPEVKEISYIQGQLEVENGCWEPIPPDSISQNVYNALQNEWDSWNLLSMESMMLSSHSPGYCLRSFDSWEECEEFLGFTIPNPLENCSWLEKATYVAMPLGFKDAPRVKASWYGTEDGHVEWIHVETGYRDGEVRVMIAASLYGDPADTKPSDIGWSIELERQNYLSGIDNASWQIDNASWQIISENTENYYSNMAYQANGNVLYRLNIVGEPDEQTQVESTLEHVISSLDN